MGEENSRPTTSTGRSPQGKRKEALVWSGQWSSDSSCSATDESFDIGLGKTLGSGEFPSLDQSAPVYLSWPPGPFLATHYDKEPGRAGFEAMRWITFDVLVWQFHHTTTTILLSVVLLLHLLLVGKWYSTLGLLNMFYWVSGCLSPCVVVCTLRLTWPFLWSCGWSILYDSSALLLHDSPHSLFTHVCLSVTRQLALHVLRNSSTCHSQFARLGGHTSSSRQAHVFLAPFCLLLFCFCTSSRKEHDQPLPMAM